MFHLFNSLKPNSLHLKRFLTYSFIVSKPKTTLFDRLGGEVAITRALDIFDNKVSNDHQLKAYFNDFMPLFREHQRKTLTIAFGEPTGFTTRDMKSIHAVSNIKEKDWEKYISLLRETLNQVVSDKDAVNEALGLVEKYKKVVVVKSVFEKLNKNVQLIKDIVATLFDKLLADKETRDFFIEINVPEIKNHLVDFLVNLFGGTASKSYKDVRMAHKTMDLTDRHFYIFKKHLNDAFRLHGVESTTIDEILFLIEKQRNEVMNRESPYHYLGGELGVAKIVDRMYDTIPNHPLLKSFFEEVDVEKVKLGQRKFIGAILGGPKYIGKDMKTIHGKMNLADAHFDAFKECFKNVLVELKLKDADIRDCTYQFEKHRREVCSISLFELLGGEPTVMRIVKTMAVKMRQNEALKGFYHYADDDEMKAVLRAEIMYTLGGPLSFRGRDIKSAHQELYITKEQFREYKSVVFQSMKEIGIVDNLIVQVVRIMENKAHYVISTRKKEEKQNII